MQSIRSKHALTGPYWIGDQQYDAPLPPGWFPGDQVNPQTGDYQRKKPQPLVGIIDLTGKVRYGFSSRGVPQFLFHPLDPRWPPMIVGSKAPTTHNQFGIAVFDSWNPTMKWAKGALQQLLGPVGDSKVEQEALRRTVCLPHKIAPLTEIPSTADIPEEVWDVTLHVDPEGCQDVDDVFSWRTREATTEFAITIADVAALVPEGGEVDLLARQKGQTVYEQGSILDSMLPKEVEKSGSLLPDGQARAGLSLVWTLTPTEVTGPRWISSRVQTTHTFSYESILDSPFADTLHTLLSRILGPLPEDSHKWVEAAMIRYNVEAAAVLHCAGNGLLRRHKGKTSTELDALADQTGCEELRFLGYAAGEYVPATEEDVGHAGLSKAMYCHATSPLRRYADLVNQRVLKRVLFTSWDTEEFTKGREELSGLANTLNDRSKAIKAFERGLWCLQTISSKGITSSEGIVLGLKPGRLEHHWRLAVYVPAWKRTIRVPLFGSEQEMVWKSGDRVYVRAFCDQREPRWEHRYVFSVGAVEDTTPVVGDVESNIL